MHSRTQSLVRSPVVPWNQLWGDMQNHFYFDAEISRFSACRKEHNYKDLPSGAAVMNLPSEDPVGGLNLKLHGDSGNTCCTLEKGG